MTIALREGQPNRRFTRYVRPPTKDDDKHPPLYPLKPATRPLCLGIDVTTVPEPPAGTFSTFLNRDELDIQLLVPQGTEPPVPASPGGFNAQREELDVVAGMVAVSADRSGVALLIP